jgi:hypothetical protein
MKFRPSGYPTGDKDRSRRSLDLKDERLWMPVNQPSRDKGVLIVMKHIKIFGLAIAAMAAMGAATSSSALAALFLASSAPGTLLGELLGGKHKFVTTAGTVECSVAHASGSITAKDTKLQLALVAYSGCEVPGIGPATVTPQADYLFHANGQVTLDNEVTIKASICTVKVPPQGPLSKVKYLNIAGPPMKIELDAEVTGITYTTSTFCPGGAKTEHNGTYAGKELVEEVGGELLFDA